MRILAYLSLVFLFHPSFSGLWGQAAPNIQDCAGAIPICQPIYAESVVPNGSGNVPNEVSPTLSCMDSEKSSIWYSFTVNNTGFFGFLLTPNNLSDDYDWAVFNLTNATCADIKNNASLMVSCNAAGGGSCNGKTGAVPGGTYALQGAGCNVSVPNIDLGKTAFNNMIPALAGNTYVLVVSNWTQSQNGYTIDFGNSNVGIFDTLNPTITDVRWPSFCGGQNIEVLFNENLQCNSVAKHNFLLTLPDGSVVQPANVSAAACSAGGKYDKKFILQFANRFTQEGNYVLQVLGNQTTELKDNCGNTCDTLVYSFLNPRLEVQDSLYGIACHGEPTGRIETLAGYGTPPYAYVWEDGSANKARSNLMAGTYRLTVSDVNGCTRALDYTLPQPPPLEIQIATDTLDCHDSADGTATAGVAGGTPPYLWSWSDGQNTAAAAALPAGVYTVSVSDLNGCSRTADITLTAPPPLVATMSASNISCKEGLDGFATVAVQGGTAPFALLWSNLSTADSIQDLGAGNYQVTITDARGCTAALGTTLTEPDWLAAALTTGAIACHGASTGTMKVDAGGGTAPYLYQWQDGATAGTRESMAAGTYTVTVIDAQGCTATVSDTLSAPPPLWLSGLTNPVDCHGASTGGITVATDGGTYPYTFTWSHVSEASSPSALPAGTYTVTLTDAQGCTLIQDFLIGQPPPLEVQLTMDSVRCFGLADAQVTAAASGGSPPYSFGWSTADTTATLMGIGPGLFQLTITDGHGCTAVREVAVTQPDLLEVSASTVDVSCYGKSDGRVETTWTGGTPPLTYAWNSGHQTAAAGQLPPGFYVLTVTDAVGCTAVYASAISTPEALELSVQQQNIPCFNGNNGELSVAPTGGTPPYQYAWSGGSTLPTLSNLPAGIYECVVTDHNGCTLQALRELIQPPQLAGVLAAIPVRCFGAADGQIQASAFGGTQPYRFSWSNSLTTSALVGLAPGNYGLTLTDANDCTAVLQASITEPPQLISTGSGSGVSCFAGDDGTATASASGGTPPYAYSWSNGSSGSQLSGISAGAYTATATDALGCQTLVSVGIGSPEPLQVAGELVPVRCHAGQDGGIALSVAGGSPPYTFLWENGDDLPFRQNLGGGDYLVAVTDAEGCREEQAFIIAEPPPLEADLGADVSISLGQQVELEVITNAAPAQLAQIRWLGEATDTTCAACVSIARLPRRSGCFEVQLLTTAGCRAGDAVCVVVRPDRYVFIPNVIQPDLDGVNDALTVYTDLSVRQVVTFQVFNRWGGLVFENRGFVPNQESMGWDGTLAGEPLQPGVYIWRAVIEFIDDTRTQLEGDVLLIR